MVALSSGGDIMIVEIKSCLLDYRTDGKWQDYLPFCDRLYFAVAADFPCEVIPDEAGLMLADRYGAELVREPDGGASHRRAPQGHDAVLRPRRGAAGCSSTSIPACGFEFRFAATVISGVAGIQFEHEMRQTVLRRHDEDVISARAWRGCAARCGDAC